MIDLLITFAAVISYLKINKQYYLLASSIQLTIYTVQFSFVTLLLKRAALLVIFTSVPIGMLINTQSTRVRPLIIEIDMFSACSQSHMSLLTQSSALVYLSIYQLIYA